MTPLQRLARMRKSFAKDFSILTEDYEFFRTVPTNLTELAGRLDAPSLPSKATCKSEEQSSQPDPVPSETNSSDRSDD